MKYGVALVILMTLLSACSNVIFPKDPSGSLGEIPTNFDMQQHSTTDEAIDEKPQELSAVIAQAEDNYKIFNNFALKTVSLNDILWLDVATEESSNTANSPTQAWTKRVYSPDEQSYIDVFYNYTDVDMTNISVVYDGVEIDSQQIWEGGGDRMDTIATWVSNDVIALGFNIWHDPPDYTASLFFTKTYHKQKLEYPAFIVPFEEGQNNHDIRYSQTKFPISHFSPSGRFMFSYLPSDYGYGNFLYDVQGNEWTQIYGGFEPFSKLHSPWVFWVNDEMVRFCAENYNRKGFEEYEQRKEGWVTFEYNLKTKQLTEIFDGEVWGSYKDYLVCTGNGEKTTTFSIYSLEEKMELLYMPEGTSSRRFTDDYRYVYFAFDNFVVVYDAANRMKYILDAGQPVSPFYFEGKLCVTINDKNYALPL